MPQGIAGRRISMHSKRSLALLVLVFAGIASAARAQTGMMLDPRDAAHAKALDRQLRASAPELTATLSEEGGLAVWVAGSPKPVLLPGASPLAVLQRVGGALPPDAVDCVYVYRHGLGMPASPMPCAAIQQQFEAAQQMAARNAALDARMTAQGAQLDALATELADAKNAVLKATAALATRLIDEEQTMAQQIARLENLRGDIGALQSTTAVLGASSKKARRDLDSTATRVAGTRQDLDESRQAITITADVLKQLRGELKVLEEAEAQRNKDFEEIAKLMKAQNAFVDAIATKVDQIKK